MAQARKTVTVASVKAICNGILANSHDDLRDSRTGVATVLERVLMDADAYKGFRYADDASGESDPTRRYYF